jgi:hypothetical protein
MSQHKSVIQNEENSKLQEGMQNKRLPASRGYRIPKGAGAFAKNFG